MNKNRFKLRVAVFERDSVDKPWYFVEYIDQDNQHWGLTQCGDVVSFDTYSAHYTRENAPDSVHRVYEPEMCTGLKDQKGKLVYENDILKNPNKDNFRVVWLDSGYWYLRSVTDTTYGCALAAVYNRETEWTIVGNGNTGIE